MKLKKKSLLICLVISLLLGASGCSRYGSIKEELEEVTVQNILPDVTKADYKRLADADDAIYEQQLAACKMLSEAYADTYFKDFLDEGKRQNENKVAQLCNDKRNNIDSEISTNFILNIYHIISNVKDCPNQDAFLEKTYSDVLNFYDSYNNYITGSDKNKALCDILINYSERNNLLALTFLAKNEQKVYNAATSVIEENAAAEESDDYTYRYYINNNNRIINALNNVFDGVPQVFAKRISNAGTRLAEKLMNSLDSISDAEKERLMKQMTAPSDTPEPTDAPEIVLPSLTPQEASTPAPVLTPAPRVTAPPAVTVTQRPVVQVTQRPVSQAPAVQATQTPQQPQPTEEPGYSFSVEDDQQQGDEQEGYYFD